MRTRNWKTLFAGAATVLLTLSPVLCVRGADASPAPSKPRNAYTTEHIFICCIYGPDRRGNFMLPEALRRVGALRNGDLWYYTNVVQQKICVIHLADTAEEMIEALYTEDAHIIVNGHSNYGMGCVFANNGEQSRQKLMNIRYADDDRFLIYSSPWVAANIPKFQTHQSYPNWWPVFKDGTSAIMPYDFGDSRGDPAYNYYPTYQIPGDPTRYKIEAVPHSALERFPDCGRPAWYAADGSIPTSKKPDERKYFIVNTNLTVQVFGRWQTTFTPGTFYGSNYLSIAAGAGSNQVRWTFLVGKPGTNTISAQWPALPGNVTNAQYTVTHAQGATVVNVNQQSNGGCWVPLGDFKFDAGTYSVVLTDKVPGGTGNIVADAIRITRSTITDEIIDNVASPRPHFGKKTMVAQRQTRLDPAKFRYKRLFYEGCLSGVYYLDVFHRGVEFYTLADSYLSVFETYLGSYLRGGSDEQVWAAIQELEPVFEYYDFSLPPSQQNGRQVDGARQMVASPGVNDANFRRLARGSPQGVFDSLRQPQFLHNEELARALVLAAFADQKEEGIHVALAQMEIPLIEKTDEGRQSRVRGLLAAKRIFEAMPEQSMPRLLDLYARSGAIIRANIIRAAGQIPGDPAVDRLLLAALSDNTVCEGSEWNSGGVPMRISDTAYIQLVLRHGVKGVLHTIGQTLSNEDRDYHIAQLKEKLKGMKDLSAAKETRE